MRRKILILLFGVLLLLFLFFMLNKESNRVDTNEGKYSEREFVPDVLFQLVDKSCEDGMYTFVLSISNGREEEISYGDYYFIETLADGKWCSFYELQAWQDIAYCIGPKSKSEIVIFIDDCPEMVTGTYRIVKNIVLDGDAAYQEGYIAAEFQME